MKYEIKKTGCGYILYEETIICLICFGDIVIYKENWKNRSYYMVNKECFDYKEISKPLCGKEPNENGQMFFTPKRILVIQMI